MSHTTLIILGLFSLTGWIVAVYCGCRARKAERAAAQAKRRSEAAWREAEQLVLTLSSRASERLQAAYRAPPRTASRPTPTPAPGKSHVQTAEYVTPAPASFVPPADWFAGIPDRSPSSTYEPFYVSGNGGEFSGGGASSSYSSCDSSSSSSCSASSSD